MNEHNSREWLILIALIRAVSDQALMLQDLEKHRAKMILKSHQKEANRLNKIFEGMFKEVVLDEVSDVITDAINKLRKEIIVID